MGFFERPDKRRRSLWVGRKFPSLPEGFPTRKKQRESTRGFAVLRSLLTLPVPSHSGGSDMLHEADKIWGCLF